MKTFKEIQEAKSAASRLTKRLKGKGVDLDKRAKDRKAELDRLKAKYAKEDSIDESPLVMDDMDIVDTLFKKIKEDMSKARRQKKSEKNWPKLQALAQMAGYGITKKGQAKDKSFRYDIKK